MRTPGGLDGTLLSRGAEPRRRTVEGKDKGTREEKLKRRKREAKGSFVEKKRCCGERSGLAGGRVVGTPFLAIVHQSICGGDAE